MDVRHGGHDGHLLATDADSGRQDHSTNGQPFKLTMATIGRWNGGKMIEESLFWDNQDFMRQIGLAK